MSFEDRFPLISMDPVTKAAVAQVRKREHCHCVEARSKKGRPLVHAMHVEPQDTSAQGWAAIASLVRARAEEAATVFEPGAELPWEEWMGVITLPHTIADLTEVQQMRLYGSHLRRLPPEVGRMAALQNLDIYTSYSLHWLPYEVLRCRRLNGSRMSTRALYGNKKTGLPFPRLRGPIETLTPSTCSVCDRSFDRTPEVNWITLPVGTDMVPLLIHSCSRECLLSVPTPPEGYFDKPHKGGGGVGMPDRDPWSDW